MVTTITKDSGGKNEMADMKIYEELQALVTAVSKNKPRPTDVSKLKRFFEDNHELWRELSQTHNAAIDMIKKEYQHEGQNTIIEANYWGIRRDLGYDQANALECILIDHVALCWLRLYATEQRYTNILHKESIPLYKADYWERRLSHTQKRYLRAVESLAKVRRLRLPAMQVNIADKQVNIAGE